MKIAVFIPPAALFILCWAIANPVGTKWIPFATISAILSLSLLTAPPLFIFYPASVYLMAVGILFGPATCVVATAVYALCAALILRFHIKQTLILVHVAALLVIDAFAYSVTYKLIGGTGGVIAMAIVSFLISSQPISLDLVYWLKKRSLLIVASLTSAGLAAWVANVYYRSNIVPLIMYFLLFALIPHLWAVLIIVRGNRGVPQQNS